MFDANLDTRASNWSESQDIAEQIQRGISKLNREKGVLIRIFGVPMLGLDVVDILDHHTKLPQGVTDAPKLDVSLEIISELLKLDIPACRLDLGKLSVNFAKTNEDMGDFLDKALALLEAAKLPEQPTDVILYGFGRIGRLLARQFIERAGPANLLRLRAVVVRPDRDGKAYLEKRVGLLQRDSVHGQFNASISLEEDQQTFTANGQCVQLITANAPDEIDYSQYGIENAIVIDNTGAWRDRAGLERHLGANGVSKILLTAPGKGDLKNIVFGVNESEIAEDDRIISAASCTTNAITPTLKVLHEKYGVEQGHVETIHSYTNDQNLIDNFHKADRRGRAAGLNMVITSTGAASAVSKAYPALAGKLTGNAIRVPTPNVSLAILNLTLSTDTSVEELNGFLSQTAQSVEYQKQLGYISSSELVSSDLVGSRYAGVVDAEATICEGNRCVLYVWYDNEFGYSAQVYRVLQQMAGVELLTLPV